MKLNRGFSVPLLSIPAVLGVFLKV